MAAPNGDSGVIGIVLFRTDFADNERVADFLMLVHWDVIVVNEKNVLVLATRLVFGMVPVPIPWQRQPNPFAYDVSHMSLYRGS